MKRLLAGVVLFFGLAALLPAAELQPSHVAQDAKWILHMDFDAFRQTQLAREIREKKLDKPEVRQRLDWVRDRYGIDLRKDLHGLTLYGNSYERHQGIALLMADFDQKKIQEVLKGAPGHETSEYRGYTLHTWNVDKPEKEKGAHKHDGKHAEKKCHKEDEDKKDKEGKEDKGEHRHGEHRHGDHRHTVTAALRENTVVLASDPERVKKALDVLEGEQSGLKKDSPLVGKRPEGTVFYGAAVDLAELKNRKGVFDFPVLQQAQRVQVAVGQHDNQAFKHVQFVAQSEEVARKLQQVLEGVQAMLQLHSHTKPHLGKIAEGMKWNVEGETLTYDGKADASAVLQHLEEMKKRAKYMERWEEMFEDAWEHDKKHPKEKEAKG